MQDKQYTRIEWVNAWQVGGEEAMPPWIEKNIKDGKLQRIYGGTGFDIIRRQHLDQRVYEGEWILDDLEGGMVAISDGIFQAHYLAREKYNNFLEGVNNEVG